MTQYFKATARGVIVTRSSARRQYTYAVIAWLRPRAADQWFPNGLPARLGDPSFHSSRVLAEQARGVHPNAEWVEIAPVEEIDAKAYRALRAAR